MKPNALPPLEFLKMRFFVSLDSPSGLRWRNPNPQAKAVKVGDIAGSLCKDGYYQVKLTYNKKQFQYQTHRIVYVLTHEDNIDNLLIDHKQSKNNNSFNLRKADYTTNSFNRKTSKTSKRTSIYKGVSFYQKKKGLNKKWRAVITAHKQTYNLGYFQTEIEAAQAYDKKAKELHGEFAKLNFPD
jgi:hypothetical protein